MGIETITGETVDVSDLSYSLLPGSAVLPDRDLDHDLHEVTSADLEVPDGDPEIDEYDEAQDGNDFEALAEAISRISTEYGVVVTNDMKNFIFAQSAVLSVDDNALRWFMNAITFGNNRKILPNLEAITEDMRTEVKNLQSASKEVRTVSTDIIKKMVSVKDEIFTGFDLLRKNVIEKLIELPRELKQELTATPTSGTNVGPRKKQLLTSASPVSSITAEKQPESSTPSKIWREKKKEVIEEGKMSVTETGASSIEVKTPSDDAINKLKDFQIRLLKRMGVKKSWVFKLSPELISKIIPPAVLPTLMEQWDSSTSQEMKDEILMRLDTVESSLK
ncbi:TPA_asm: P [Ilex alphacytorhabdovirus 1]|nr:TPA_asm: P [Ilex alphacytorhabdovirus 1]